MRLRRRPRADTVRASLESSGRSDTLCFVGFEKSVENGIDWRSSEMSRLWRYHLHYFDYLRDGNRTAEWKQAAIDDWIARNPPGTRDAWEPYPTSLRIVNWIKFFDEIAAEEGIIDVNWQHSLYRQTLWLENNLERHVLANHYLKNAKALVFAGVFFEGADAERWLTVGLRILRSEIAEQFLDDGGHYERSPMYHVICLEDLLDTLSMLAADASLGDDESRETIRSCASAGLDFLDAILMPDGEIPLFNDSAFGMAAAPRDVFAYAGRLIGYNRPERGAGPVAKALGSSGYYVIRDGADALIIDCGDPGPAYQPGHAHCDTLSYELSIAGERLIVDSGVYGYEAGEARRISRSTAAHNTVSVDGREQSEIWDVFRVGRRARPIEAFLSSEPDLGIRFEGAHDGFRRVGDGVVHRRVVEYVPRRWAVKDTLEGSGVHLVESRIHLAPDLHVRRTETTIFEIINKSGSTRAKIACDCGAAVQIERAAYHPRFGTTEERLVIVLSRTERLPISLGYTLEAAA